MLHIYYCLKSRFNEIGLLSKNFVAYKQNKQIFIVNQETEQIWWFELLQVSICPAGVMSHNNDTLLGAVSEGCQFYVTD